MTTEIWITKRPIARRGVFDNKTVAENSASSIINAIKHDYAIELDVLLTKDKKPIVFHDESLSRMTGHNGYVSNCDYTEIKNLTLLKTTDTILTLDEVLNLVGGKVPLLLNLKFEHIENNEKFVYTSIKNYAGELAIESSNPYILEWFKVNAPSIIRGQRSASFHHEHPTFAKKRDLKNLKLNHISEPNFISYKLEDAKMFRLKKHILARPLLLWTVKDKRGINKVKKFGANFVFDGINCQKIFK